MLRYSAYFSILALTMFFASACQSKTAAIQVVCDAPSEAGLYHGSPDVRLALLARHIEENISNDEVRALIDSMATMRPAERRAVLKAEAAEAGIENCEMLAVWSQ